MFKQKARWTFVVPGLLALVALTAGAGALHDQLVGSGMHPATGIGSCTLKGWNPNADPNDAKDLPEGHRPQTYKRDDYDCNGAKFAASGAEFAKFPQPNNFQIDNKQTVMPVPQCQNGSCNQLMKAVMQPAAVPNPLAPYFPPFQHFVILYRENHTFDDYLGDCPATIQAGCNGVVQSTNHISSVPNLHTLAQTNALLDTYSTGTQPPSGPNHWWLFSGQSSSSSQQQSYPAASGTQFDRFLKGPSGGYTFVMNGDFYWMLNTGSGYWTNPATGAVEALPVNRPGTTIPEELNYNHYTCCGQNDDDQTIATDYENFVTTNGLPAYSYVELFNDHPGTFQDIPKNDAVTKQIVDSIMNNAAYKDNTLIVVTEDDTQNGSNGPDHISNTYRVPTVVIASPTYMKQHYVSHVAYKTDNVLAAMERTMNNVHPGVIDPNNNIGLATFPMTTADQSGLGDPLEDLWVQGSTPLSATAAATPTTGNAPLNVSFTGSATGGTAPYSYSWNFGDGSAASTTQNPSHTYASACTCQAVLTVTDASTPAKTATSAVTINATAVGSPLSAVAAANPTSGQTPLSVAFTGTATGGTPAYSYSWNFGDGTAASTQQNPSHTYNNAGTYAAALTVTDSSSPVKTATSSVTITASPIAGTAPGAPTGLAASAGPGQVSLNWTAPASNGGVNITSYKVYRGTASGGETPVTTGGCSGLGAVASCTDSGLTNGQPYFYKVSAVNAIGEGAQSNEASAAPTASPLSQNFDGGTAIPAGWTATGLWRVGSTCLGAASAPNSLQFNSASTCTYNPLRSSGFATSPAFDISTAAAPTLTFNTKYQVESYSGHTDQMTVQAKTATGSWTTLWTRDSTNPAQTTFAPVTLDLSAYKSNGSQIRFSFDSMDTYPRSYPGWAVDDVGVQTGVATAPGAPTGLAAASGNAQVSLSWAAPASNGGSAITSYKVYRGTASGAETLLALGGCSGLGSVTSCTDATVTNGQPYFYKVSAVNAVGESTLSNEATATPASAPTQLMGNPGFENGSTNPAPWVATSGVIGSPASEPPHTGSWDAWLDGYGTTHTDTLYQQVAIPSTVNSAQLGFWLHIDTAETSTTTAYDTLQVQVRNQSGTVLGTLATYSNLNAATGYTQKTFDLSAYKGQTIQIYLLGQEDSTLQTSFVVDDFALNAQ